MAFLPRPVTMMMLSTPDCDGFFDAVLNDWLVDERQHFFRLSFGGGKKPGAETCGREDDFANGRFHGPSTVL